MEQQYFSSTFIRKTADGVAAVFGWSQRAAIPLDDPGALALLECFVTPQTLASAYQTYQAFRGQASGRPRLLEQLHFGGDAVIQIMGGAVVYLAQGFRSYLEPEQQVKLTGDLPLFTPYPDLDFSEFQNLFQRLYDQGLIVPAVGHIHWGNVRRWSPVCAITGFSRGTPIDRYYQRQFLHTVKDKIRGSVLEIGGVAKDREFYDFALEHVTSYCCVNLEPGAGVDVVGDAHNPELVAADTADTVFIFNVLEHCYEPQRVVQNIHRWLRPGGWCLALVPTAQRLHDRPADYWRLLPDGLNYLFRNYAQCHLYTYGNTLTVLANFLGVAAEELTSAELAIHHPDYPVIACVAAQK